MCAKKASVRLSTSLAMICPALKGWLVKARLMRRRNKPTINIEWCLTKAASSTTDWTSMIDQLIICMVNLRIREKRESTEKKRRNLHLLLCRHKLLNREFHLRVHNQIRDIILSGAQHLLISLLISFIVLHSLQVQVPQST